LTTEEEIVGKALEAWLVISELATAETEEEIEGGALETILALEELAAPKFDEDKASLSWLLEAKLIAEELTASEADPDAPNPLLAVRSISVELRNADGD